jgi:hypothetical protein
VNKTAAINQINTNISGATDMKKLNVKKLFGIKKREKIYRYSQLPSALQTRIIKELAFALLILVLGILLALEAGIGLGDRLAMIGLTLVAAGVMVYMAYSTYITMATGEYDIYEGICIDNSLAGKNAIKLWSALKKNRSIQIEGNDGKAYTLICKENRRIARTGYPVRVYTSKTSKPILKNGEYVIYQYLAIESLGKKQQEQENAQ